MTIKKKIGSTVTHLVSLCAVTGILVFMRAYFGFLPFHVFAELFAVVVFFSIFLFAWNSYERIDNGFLKLIGIGFLFIGFIDVVHTLTYKGMNLLPGHDANTPTQLWIAARGLQALSFPAGLLLIKRNVNKIIALFVFTAITACLLIGILFIGIFPDCLIEGRLTPFKIAMEYVISGVVAASIALLFLRRRYFNQTVFFLILTGLLATILSELAFTLYTDVYDIMNFSGHLLKIISVFLFYLAIIEIGVRAPFDLVFKNLKEHDEALEKALGKVKTLSGLLPICASCKKIRDDKGYWKQVEEYISLHSDIEWTHGLCPDCYKKYASQIDQADDR